MTFEKRQRQLWTTVRSGNAKGGGKRRGEEEKRKRSHSKKWSTGARNIDNYSIRAIEINRIHEEGEELERRQIMGQRQRSDKAPHIGDPRS